LVAVQVVVKVNHQEEAVVVVFLSDGHLQL
jgi:hypothetical protein